jgi:hypothetical protein
MLTAVLLICVHLIYVHCHPRSGVHSLGSSKSPVLSTEAIEHNPALKGGSFSRNHAATYRIRNFIIVLVTILSQINPFHILKLLSEGI